jgi:hypothetical protein
MNCSPSKVPQCPLGPILVAEEKGSNERSSCTSKGVYRSSVLVLLGLILLSPFALLRRDVVLAVVATSNINSVQVDALQDSSGYAGSLTSQIERQKRVVDNNDTVKWTADTGGATNCLPVDTVTTHGDFFPVPDLETVQEWVSKKSIPINRSISVVTQLSIDRLPMLENQCRSWKNDVLVAAIYVPLEKVERKDSQNIPFELKSSMSDVIRSVDAFYSLMESTPSACALHVQLVGQRIESDRSSPYPINSLRNRALEMAQTPLIFMLDVDFVASPKLGLDGAGYREKYVYDELLRVAKSKGAIVVPAFELSNRQLEPYIGENVVKNLIVQGKDTLRKAYKQELVNAFNSRDFDPGHGPTNTSRWIRMRKQGPGSMYTVKYQDKYEPFVILARDLVPRADERFVGYGANKLVFIKYLESLGFKFHVHGSGFSIHVPHAKTRAANIFIAHRKGKTKDPMDVLRAIVEGDIEDGVYKPVTRTC